MRLIYHPLLLALLFSTTAACRNSDYIELENSIEQELEEQKEEDEDNDDDEYDPDQVDEALYPDWSESTHSKNAEPNYDIVFAQNSVQRLDLTISSTSWSQMLADLKSNLSSNNNHMGGGNMGGGVDVDFTPIWVPCTLTYNDRDWYEVGVRFKGNSSLSSAYSSGVYKFSMKLDFDEYEDDYPALKNQRFYGFKQLNLNSNYNDSSLMREKVASDLFRQFGLASAQTSFYALYIDTGSGAQYFGLYTLVEEVDDTVIETQFSDGSGNLYKPEDDAAYFKSGTYDEDEFYLKTNTDTADYSDVLALYNAINSSMRTSDITAWQTLLESTFDVDTFLRWLAANITLQNWDTYGNMAHNYFLYNNPTTGLLTWIPWDNNESLQSGNGALAPNLSTVSSSWPLIKYIIAVDEYEQRYEEYLREFIDEVFIAENLSATYESYYNLLKQYAYDERSGYTFIKSDYYFDSAVSTLKTHASSRVSVIESYLK